MKFKIQPYSIHELGHRKNQEDSMFPQYGNATTEDRLFLVCDGMGGHDLGEVASNAVCSSISNYIIDNADDNDFTENVLKNAISVAYDKLDELDNGSEKKMGTTMTLLKLHSEGATIAHIGDSRVYHIRPGVGVIFVTTDHSLVNDLLKAGELTEEEAKSYPHKNVITRAMQPCLERRYNADIYHTSDIQPGDYFYLCSDGMLEEATDENIEYIFSLNISDNEKVELLLKNSEDNKDNHTAYIIKVEEVEDSVICSNKDIIEYEKEENACTTIENNQEQSINERVEIRHKIQLNKFYKWVIILLLFILGTFSFYIIYSNNSKNELESKESTTEVKPELPFKTGSKKDKQAKETKAVVPPSTKKEDTKSMDENITSQTEGSNKQDESVNNNIQQEIIVNEEYEDIKPSIDTKNILKEAVKSAKDNKSDENLQNVVNSIK